MNIQFQICGLSILFLLILFYKSHKTLQLYKERVFYAVLRIITVSLMADVLSLAAIRYRQSMPLLLVETICKSYIVTSIWGAWSALIYVLTDIVTEKKHKKITGRFILLLTAQSLIVYLLPIYIYENGNQVYTYGPSIIWVYICVALYIIATVTITCVYRKKDQSQDPVCNRSVDAYLDGKRGDSVFKQCVFDRRICQCNRGHDPVCDHGKSGEKSGAQTGML